MPAPDQLTTNKFRGTLVTAPSGEHFRLTPTKMARAPNMLRSAPYSLPRPRFGVTGGEWMVSSICHIPGFSASSPSRGELVAETAKIAVMSASVAASFDLCRHVKRSSPPVPEEDSLSITRSSLPLRSEHLDDGTIERAHLINRFYRALSALKL